MRNDKVGEVLAPETFQIFLRRIFFLAFILSVKSELVVRVWQPVRSSGGCSASLLLLLPLPLPFSSPPQAVHLIQFWNASVENSAENQGWVRALLEAASGDGHKTSYHNMGKEAVDSVSISID